MAIKGNAHLDASTGKLLSAERDTTGLLLAANNLSDVTAATARTNLGVSVTSSGTYTPTRSAEANMDANVTTALSQYSRTGDVVTVSGTFTADPTLTATTTSFEITLPVASNIGAIGNLSGVAFCGAIVGQGAQITGSVANDTAVIFWKSADVTSQVWSFIFTYQVI